MAGIVKINEPFEVGEIVHYHLPDFHILDEVRVLKIISPTEILVESLIHKQHSIKFKDVVDVSNLARRIKSVWDEDGNLVEFQEYKKFKDTTIRY